MHTYRVFEPNGKASQCRPPASAAHRVPAPGPGPSRPIHSHRPPQTPTAVSNYASEKSCWRSSAAPTRARQWHGARRNQAVSAASPAPAATQHDSGHALVSLQTGDLLQCSPATSSTSVSQANQADPIWLEISSPWDPRTQSCGAVWEGRSLTLTLTEDNTIRVTQRGTILQGASTQFLSAFPALAKLNPRMSAPLPWERLDVTTAKVVDSLNELEKRVSENPGPWCQGTAPGESPPQGLDYQLQSAGQLLALMSGHRGLVMIQLWVGWDAAAPQPVLKPFVITLLKRVVTNKDLGVVTSTVSGGLGVTALIHANKEPFRSYAKHMASFCAQAALVAGSPYYKLLIGRMLGYPEAHIEHHIQATGGGLTSQVITQVAKDLSDISNKKPQLPWNTNSRKKIKKPSSSG